MKNLLFTLLLTIVIISMLFAVTAVTAFAAEATVDSPKFGLGATPDSPSKNLERTQHREYIKNNVTIDHEFIDNEVTVLLYEDENPYDYTLETFEKYGVINVKRSEYNEYFLLLTLDRHDKQNVLDVCYALYDIPGIEFADPNYIPYDDPIIVPITEPTTLQSVTNTATPDTPQNFNGKTDNSTIATGNSFQSMYLAGLAAV